MRLPSAACISLILLASVISSRAVDPALAGFWLDSTPAPTQGFTENILWEIFPEGELDEHWQHTLSGQPVVLNSKMADVNTYPTLIHTHDGRITETEEDRSTRSGSYVMCPDKNKLIVKFDDTPFAFLFLKYGTFLNDQESTSHPDGNGVLFRDASGSNDPDAGITSRFGSVGTAHWVDPGLAGVWIDSIPKAADSSARVSLWEVHPDGNTVLHVQNVTSSQPLDLTGSDHDIQTIVQNFDAFGGRFVMASQDGTSKETGRYETKGDELTLAFDKNGTTLVFQRYGSFNPDGSIKK